ncbi:MAG: hypothetical protein AAGF86_20430, partial [Pseudomonadota bacterium]
AAAPATGTPANGPLEASTLQKMKKREHDKGEERADRKQRKEDIAGSGKADSQGVIADKPMWLHSTSLNLRQLR